MKKKDFIKNKWYKDVGSSNQFVVKFSHFQGKSLYMYGYIEYGKFFYKKDNRTWLTDFTADAKEIPLSEIQQYLPDNHPDKINSYEIY